MTTLEKRIWLEAQMETITLYYVRIGQNMHLTSEDIMQLLELDIQHLREEMLILQAQEILEQK